MTEISLGNEVKDRVSGIVGIATCMIEAFDGNVRFAVQTPSVSAEKIDESAIEADRYILEYVGPGLADTAIEPGECEIEIGHKVRDIVSGFKGIAISKLTCLNGCVYFSVMPKMKKHSKKAVFNLNPVMPEPVSISSRLLEYVGEGVVEEAREAAEAPTGGPTTRFKRP